MSHFKWTQCASPSPHCDKVSYFMNSNGGEKIQYLRKMSNWWSILWDRAISMRQPAPTYSRIKNTALYVSLFLEGSLHYPKDRNRNRILFHPKRADHYFKFLYCILKLLVFKVNLCSRNQTGYLFFKFSSFYLSLRNSLS